MSIDWTTWTPRERATLLFVIRDGQILLIEKKRGLGAGKVNGPGGRLEPGETPLDCALRETHEELHIRPTGVSEAGVLMFQFAGTGKLSGHSIHCTVFRASGFEGTPTETHEAKPLWTPVSRIPFDRMWADDSLWVPHMLSGRRFVGQFVFDDDAMLWHDVRLSD